MVTRAKVFEGAISTADTKTAIGSAYTFPSGSSRVVALLVGIGDEGVQEPHDAHIVLEFTDVFGPFEFTVTMGGATASAASFQLQPAAMIPVDIPVKGGSTSVTLSALSSGTPEAVRVSLVFE